ncbi:hypothetical protein TcasGA2_TC002586 [Tribolium castaneum]|uniref:Mutator-like transposase domain-containing protein n=1 Tax=Tribolium castaneum TaxID=7070 RepID=D6WFJ7_TRICA|nr:hypothetical protein TcasGA2_TC002586 [Tribolium castaneum]
MHNVRFKNLIGDGDSSVYKKIRNARPYGPNYFIKKIECRNHILVLRNFCTKIREIAKTPRSDINIKTFLRHNYLKFRTAIVSAIKYRKNENCTFDQKAENPKNDILNGPAHIFGNHSKCATYFCKTVGQITNAVAYSDFKNSSLFELFMQALKRNSGIYTTKFSNRLLKTKELQATKLNKRKIRIQSADSDYGATNDIIDMPTETYEKIKNEFLNDLAACDILKIPLLTIGQRNNEHWDKERNNRLTASNFGRLLI